MLALPILLIANVINDFMIIPMKNYTMIQLVCVCVWGGGREGGKWMMLLLSPPPPLLLHYSFFVADDDAAAAVFIADLQSDVPSTTTIIGACFGGFALLLVSVAGFVLCYRRRRHRGR